MSVFVLLLSLALICFVLTTFGLPRNITINLTALGLAFATLAFLLQNIRF